MSIYNSVKISYEPLRSINFAAIGVNYVPIGTPFGNPVRILSVYNTTDVNLLFSLNGITDCAFSAANSGEVTDYGANKNDMGGLADLPAGSLWYVKQAGAAATLGTVYIAAIYISE
jgi:hypothetical protein